MRISTIAALLILTTMVLSTTACTQSNLAAVIDHSGTHYGWNNAQTKVIPLANKYSAPRNVVAAADPDVLNQRYDETPYMAAAPMRIESAELAAPAPTQAAPITAAVKPVPAPAQVAQNNDIFVTSDMNQLRWPVQGKVIRTFGAQDNGGISDGISIATPYGMPVRAADDGQVAYVGNSLKDFGNMLILRHNDGSMTSYAHASEIVVKKGDNIQRGALLGYVGRSGNVAEPQLAFTMRVGDQTVDPLKHLPQQFAGRVN